MALLGAPVEPQVLGGELLGFGARRDTLLGGCGRGEEGGEGDEPDAARERPGIVAGQEAAACSSSQRSASIAAMQPVPAAVTAWR